MLVGHLNRSFEGGLCRKQGKRVEQSKSGTLTLRQCKNVINAIIQSPLWPRIYITASPRVESWLHSFPFLQQCEAPEGGTPGTLRVGWHEGPERAWALRDPTELPFTINAADLEGAHDFNGPWMFNVSWNWHKTIKPTQKMYHYP